MFVFLVFSLILSEKVNDCVSNDREIPQDYLGFLACLAVYRLPKDQRGSNESPRVWQKYLEPEITIF